MNSSLERINPLVLNKNDNVGLESFRLHLDRYHYAGQHIIPGNVLDIACGVGYGSYLLATEYPQYINKITGVDNDAASILFAKENYDHPLITFLLSDATEFHSKIPLNNIISLETLEHLPNPEQIIKNLSGQLVKGGRFVASVPITPSMDANPYHLHDFTVKQFTRIFIDQGMTLLHAKVQIQPYNPLKIAFSKNDRTKDLRRNMFGYYWSHPSKLFLRLRSLFKDGFTNKYFIAVFENQ